MADDAKTLTVWEARRAMVRWLQIRREHDKRHDLYSTLMPPESREQMFGQLAADVDHSALLMRLLEGKEPLPEPPPKEHAYPVYPDE